MERILSFCFLVDIQERRQLRDDGGRLHTWEELIRCWIRIEQWAVGNFDYSTSGKEHYCDTIEVARPVSCTFQYVLDVLKQIL